MEHSRVIKVLSQNLLKILNAIFYFSFFVIFGWIFQQFIKDETFPFLSITLQNRKREQRRSYRDKRVNTGAGANSGI